MASATFSAKKVNKTRIIQPGEVIEEKWTPKLLGGDLDEGYFGINPETVRPVASYSWLPKTSEFPQPTILVPGCPRIWNSRSYPFVVSPDTGTEYGDCNISEIPECPLLPLFLSVQLMNSEVKFGSMDVICDKSVLRNILRWVQIGGLTGIRDFSIEAELRLTGIRDFSIEAELLLGTREDNDQKTTLVLLQPNAYHPYPAGLYRKNLELEHSRLPPGWEECFGHYRIITYELGQLKMLVRFPVDICDPQPENDPTNSLALPNPHAHSIRDYEMKVYDFRGGKLNCIRHPGRPVYQNSMAELVVRQENRLKRKLNWDWIWHQLYFSYTQNLFVVIHNGNEVKELLTRTRGLQNAMLKSRNDLKNVEILLGLLREYLKGFAAEGDERIKLQFDFFKKERHIRITKLNSPSNIPSLEGSP